MISGARYHLPITQLIPYYLNYLCTFKIDRPRRNVARHLAVRLTRQTKIEDLQRSKIIAVIDFKVDAKYTTCLSGCKTVLFYFSKFISSNLHFLKQTKQKNPLKHTGNWITSKSLQSLSYRIPNNPERSQLGWRKRLSSESCLRLSHSNNRKRQNLQPQSLRVFVSLNPPSVRSPHWQRCWTAWDLGGWCRPSGCTVNFVILFLGPSLNETLQSLIVSAEIILLKHIRNDFHFGILLLLQSQRLKVVKKLWTKVYLESSEYLVYEELDVIVSQSLDLENVREIGAHQERHEVAEMPTIYQETLGIPVM